MAPQQPSILLVEDDENDVFLLEWALQKTKLQIPVNVVVDGQAALDYLGSVQKYADRTAYPLPAIIFLDLKLPYVHGFEVLRWIREQPFLRDIQVHILSASAEPRDRLKASELGANGYLIKPPTPEMLLPILQPLAAVLP